MKKQLIYGFTAIALISLVSAGIGQVAKPFTFLETQDLSVLDDAYVADTLRVDGLIAAEGELLINNDCEGDAVVMADSHGLVYFDCLPS